VTIPRAGVFTLTVAGAVRSSAVLPCWVAVRGPGAAPVPVQAVPVGA
jgi:hypothetical protein